MGRTRKKGRRSKHNKSLFGIDHASNASSQKGTIQETLKKGGLVLLSAVAASGAGAALGKHSLIAGLPVFFFGIHKNNPYIAAAGLGLSLSNGFQKPGQSTQGVDGFDIKQIAEQAKDRVGTFFENFKDKFYLSKEQPEAGTSGLGNTSNEEQVSYFVNPYSASQEIDMSAIDRIQEQIAEMNRPLSGDFNEMEREF